MHFDWYQATLPVLSAQEALALLHAGLGGEIVDNRRGMNGFTNSYTINGSTGVSCTFCAGGINLFPNAFASGERTQPFLDVVRGLWPGNHNVTRMDSAQDFIGADCWEKLSSACLSVADRLNLKVQHMGDWHRRIDGRTLKFGSRNSPCHVRLYEKGPQMRKLDRINAMKIPLDWVRIEAEIHPNKNNRDKASTVSPLEAWGFSRTTREIAEACFNEKVVPVDVGRHDKSEHERTMDHAIYQYGNTFLRERLKTGGWSEFGASINQRILRMQASKTRNKV